MPSIELDTVCVSDNVRDELEILCKGTGVQFEVVHDRGPGAEYPVVRFTALTVSELKAFVVEFWGQHGWDDNWKGDPVPSEFHTRVAMLMVTLGAPEWAVSHWEELGKMTQREMEEEVHWQIIVMDNAEPPAMTEIEREEFSWTEHSREGWVVSGPRALLTGYIARNREVLLLS